MADLITLRDLIKAMLALLPAGAAVRAVHCLIKMAMDDDQRSLYKRRLTNLLVFTVAAETIVSLLYIVLDYIV